MHQDLIGTTDPKNYSSYLQEKCAYLVHLFEDHGFSFPAPRIFASDPCHYRMRAEFAIFFENRPEGKWFDYVMFRRQGKVKERIALESYTPGHEPISRLMTPLRKLILKNSDLAVKLFEIDFLVSQEEDAVIALHYHKKLDEDAFALTLEELRSDLNELGFKVRGIIAHAKKQAVTAGEPFVIEKLILDDGRQILLKQVEGTFSQPNAKVCTQMLNFAACCSEGMQDTDLLELFCGSGTFTCTLAPLYRKVLATEICRVPTKTALFNLEANNLKNTKLVRLSAAEAAQALNREREFRRLQDAEVNLDEYEFKTLLIDPPRSGLQDEASLAFTARFERIIYISCGMESLVSDLDYLTKTHRIELAACFDQFPYTPHLETGVLLVKK